METLAPIVLFVYNRPEHSLQTLEALAANDLAKDSILYIYADGSQAEANSFTLEQIEETRRAIRKKQWCKEVHIIESVTNKGLADSIVEGVTYVVNLHGKVIVLEDDIVTSPGFLTYMNDAFVLYENEEKVMHVAGFVPLATGADKLPDTYLLRFMSCWGWGTWKRAWSKLILDNKYLYETLPKQPDFSEYELEGKADIFSQVVSNYEGRNKTWAVKWLSSIFLNKGLCLYPKASMTENIGFDGSGENCIDDRAPMYNINLIASVDVYPIEIKENKYARQYLKNFYTFGKDSAFKSRLKFYLKKMKHYLKTTLVYKFYLKLRYS